LKPIETWIYAALLLISLGLAWSAWQGDDDSEQGAASRNVVVFDPGSGGVALLDWHGERNVASVEIDAKGDELLSWVSAGKRPKIDGPTAPEAAGDDDSAAAAEEEPAKPAPPVYGEPEMRSFPGGKKVAELVERFAPLRAIRRFDTLDDETLAEMGLDEPKATLSMTSVAGKSLDLQVGGKAYGSSDTYVRNETSGTVYLLSSKVLGPLRSAESRLMERNILGFPAVDAKEATLAAATGASRTLSHQGTHDEDNAYWADPTSADQLDTNLDGFMKKIFQLRATTYPKDDERPAAESVESVLRVAFAGGKDRYLELGRILDEKRSREDEPAYDWHARTHLTRDGWVRVSRTAGRELGDALGDVVDR
jgi:hypothetical protein